MNAMVVLGIVMSLGAPGPKDKPASDPLIGLWELERSVPDPMPGNSPFKQVRWQFNKDGNWVVFDGEKEIVAARPFKFDPKANPASLDFTVKRGEKEVILAIYKVDADKLTICTGYAGDARPTEFVAPSVGTYRIMIFRRVKADD